MNRRLGFTLLEVLIALVVVALALLALTRTAGGQVRSFDALRERTLAGWVAANVLSETRIATPLPAIGKRDGRVRLANREWRWQLEVKATDDPDMRRLDVQVFAADSDQPSASLTGFGSEQPSP
ncbi:MAG: type II secretion system minor pseudopilin GspI [Dokdonella sp.]|nr:type II secretion system minor pseudopilin GspI [Xanthomonadales bacterium]MCB1578648.1 type II secretion system minor pseudopilin GspI [Xanthomonadales bacterium]